MVLKIAGIIKYGVVACAELVCNVNIKPYTPVPKHNHIRQISTPPAGFESAIPASMRLQTDTLDRSAIGIDYGCVRDEKNVANNHPSRKYTLKCLVSTCLNLQRANR